MSSIPPKNEARRRPVSVLALKLWEMAEALDEHLDDPTAVLDVLVNSAAKGEQALETWDRLHEAAARFDKTAELALAYEQVTHDKRIKLLPPEQQAFIFLQAAQFFSERLADPDIAVGYAERAIAAVPGHPQAFSELEKLLNDSGKLERLSRLYLDASQRESDPERRLSLLTRSFSIASSIEAVELVIEAGQKLVKLSPENGEAREEVMRRLISTGRHKEVVELLEYALSREPPPETEEAKLHRELLVDLCFTVLKSPERAMTHVEGLLRLEPAHAMGRSVAEALLDNKQLAQRAASALSDAFEQTSELDRAVDMLTFELRHVRGPRRMEVQKRLGILRQDALGDPAGALELLAPVVAGDPGDDELRKRFVDLSLNLNQAAEAARLLGRALSSHRDLGVRARVGVDVGNVFLKSGDPKRAQAAFAKVLEVDADAPASLEAARRLSELLSDGGDQEELIAVLSTVVRLEPEKELRQAAARRLARLCDGESPDLDRAILAYRALVGSPWTDEALRRLEALYTQSGDDIGLSDVLAFRAERAGDKHEARELAVRALDLRTSRTRDPEAAIQAYQSFASSFGASRDVHARLMPLLEQTGRFLELAVVLSQEVELASEEEKKRLLVRLAQTRLAQLSDPEGALSALARALHIDPADRSTRAVLEKLLGVPEVRLRAASVLEPLYRQEEPGAGLLKVLETRAESAPTSRERLSAAEEAVELAETHVRDPERALETAGKALSDAVASAPDLIEHWLSEVERLGLNPNRRARFLFSALGERAIDSRELFALARAAGEAARADGDIPRAIQALRQALAFEPSSHELVRAIDDLLVQEGAPAERLALYESALEKEQDPKRRRELLHAMARLRKKDLDDAPGALSCLRRAAAEDPVDLVAHDALFDALMEASAFTDAALELERMLPLFEGDRRSLALLRLAEAAERAGDASASLARYRELLECADLSDDVLAKIEHLALEQRDGVTLRSVLEQRLLVATDPRERVQLLERLGNAASWQLGDAASAAGFWLEAARLAEGAACDPERARRLYDRVLDADAKNQEAAARLVELCALAGDFTRLAEAFAVVLENADPREIVTTLIGFENAFSQGGAQREFVSLVDRALARGMDSPRGRELGLARARSLGTLPDGTDEAAKAFRTLLDDSPDDAGPELDAFSQFLQGAESTPARKEDLRWLFRFRVNRSADQTRVLFDWARAEEHELRNLEQAEALYAKIAALDPEQTEAWSELARLQALSGNAKGALASLEALRDRVDKDNRAPVELRLAGLLLDSLGRAQEALALVRPIVRMNPSDLDALRVVHRALALPETRAEAAELLEQAAEGFDDPARRADVIEALLAVSADAPELAEARSRWLGQLLKTKSDDPEEALKIALRGAEAAPAELELWKAAEQMARKLQTPQPVLDVYERVLARALQPEVADELGRQLVEFYAEWFDDPERVVDILKRVLELCPGAGWAFDRLKLEFSGQGRWQELFTLYDTRLSAPLEASERIEVLREAAMAARDFADDPERAIGYLEALHRETPKDARVEASLERLYERHAKKRPLIELLSARLSRDAIVEPNEVRARIAALWLDLAEAEPALELAQLLYADPLRTADAVNLLERLIALPEAREFAQAEAGKPAPLLRATARLQAHYTETNSVVDVVRMLEIEESVATRNEERRRLLERIVKLRLEGLKDLPGALETVARLVLLDPASKPYRKGLSELAERVGAEARRAEVLVQAARTDVSPDVLTSLLNEAAAVEQGLLQNIPRALELYREVLARDDVPSDAELDAARALSELLRDGGPPEERVAVLERLADLVESPGARRAALGEAALLAFEALGDPPRAIAAYRKRLADDRTDLEAMHGLCVALEAAERWDELISALEARANIEPVSEARRDRIRVAEIFAQVKSDRALAIEAWRRVVAQHGPDVESFEALAQLLSWEERWVELAELFASEVAREPEPERLRSLWLELGAVHERRTEQPVHALEAYVSGGDWQSAIRVAGAQSVDRATGRRVCERLYELAVEGWASSPDGADSEPARAADWALSELSVRLLEDGEYEAAFERLLAGARLPFVTRRRRDLRREAACLASDRLGNSDRAIALFQALLVEDPADEVATSSVTRLALLLEEREEFEKLVTLWENQAEARSRSGDVAGAQLLWARAGELSEARLADADRALAAYSRGAELGGEASLEALARIHGQAGRIDRVAEALERLCALSSADALGERALALSEAQVTLGHPARARETLEFALTRVVEGAQLRGRLAELYRDARDFTSLAALIEGEAQRATDLRLRLEFLKRAAELHLEERAAPGAAVPLLESALEIEPDDSALRLRLAQALYAGARFEPAAAVLRDQLGRYGARRPKDRALVHYELARVLLASNERGPALSELDAASKIDPTHPKILQMLAKTAFEEGDLDRAERMYRSLLLVAGREGDHGAPSRSEALYALSEVARGRGDATRADEFVASALEAASENPREARVLEQALRSRGASELLARVLELRLAQPLKPEDAVRALFELAQLHAGPLDDLDQVRADLALRAARIESEIDRADSQEDTAWAALGRLYASLGDREGEGRVLERRVEVSASSSRPPPDPDLLYRLARVRLSDPAEADGALDLLDRALGLDPDLDRAEALLRSAFPGGAPPRAALLLERIARAKGDVGALVAALERRIAVGDADIEALREGIRIAEDVADPELATRLLEAALTSGAVDAIPEHAAWLRIELAKHRRSAGDVISGLALEEQAASYLSPADATSLLLCVARGALAAADLERAQRVLEALRAEDSENLEISRTLLDLYRATAQFSRLAELLDAVAPLVPTAEERTGIRLELADLLLERLDGRSEAIRVLSELARDVPEERSIRARLAELLALDGREEELAELLVQEVDRSREAGDVPSVVALSLRLASLFERTARPGDALEVCRAALELAPEHRDLLEQGVRLATATEDPERLAEACEQLLAVERGPAAGALCRRLVELRTRLDDAAGVERALELGSRACPGDMELCEQLMARYRERGDLARIAELLDRAIAERPEDPVLSERLIETHRASGRPEQALAALDDFTRRRGEELGGYRFRAALLSELGRDAEAVADLERAAISDQTALPELVQALERAISHATAEEQVPLVVSLIGALEQSGDRGAARRKLDEMAAESPLPAALLARLAALEEAGADTDAALTSYRRLVELVEGSELDRAALSVARLAAELGRPEQARPALERALALGESPAAIRAALMSVLEASGAHRVLARMLLDEALSLSKSADRLQKLLRAGDLLLADGEVEEAQRVLEMVRAEAPENLDAAVLLARAYTRSSRIEDALSQLNAVIEQNRGKRIRALAAVFEEKANTHLEEGFLTDALAALAKAFEMDPKNARLGMRLGRLALESEEDELAQRALRAIAIMKTAEVDGPEGARTDTKADANYALAVLSQRAGDARKAKVLVSKALSENPAHEAARTLFSELDRR